jgi:hypothetical protein
MTTSRRSVPLPPGWGTIATQILRRDRYCQWGSIPDDGVPMDYICGWPSTEVDHIGDPGDHRPSKLRGLCTSHHATRTGRQGAAARNKLSPLRKRPPDKHPGFKTERQN